MPSEDPDEVSLTSIFHRTGQAYLPSRTFDFELVPQLQLAMRRNRAVMLEAGQELHVPLPLTGLMQQFYTAALAGGQAKDDLSGIIRLYEVDGAPFGYFTAWEKHQRVRTRVSKHPAPPDGQGVAEHPFPTERDVEDLLVDLFVSAQNSLFGGSIQVIERQVRVDGRYIDILIRRYENPPIVVELKRGRLSNKAVEQLSGYVTATNGVGVLVGAGMTADLDLGECQRRDIAVITYDADMAFTAVLSNSVVRDLAGFPVISHPQLGSSDSDSDSDSDS